MSTVISRLESLGLVTRYRESDEQRSDVLSLTDARRAQLGDIRREW